MTARDSQRSRVYAAEEFVRTLFDRAAQHNSRAIEFFGESITLPAEARFGSVASVQRYVDQVLALPAVTHIRPDPGPITVRSRRSATAAHYETAGVAGVIAVAVRPWSLELLPTLIEPTDWARIEAGVLQRAELAETMLADLYGPRHLLHEAKKRAHVLEGMIYAVSDIDEVIKLIRSSKTREEAIAGAVKAEQEACAKVSERCAAEHLAADVRAGAWAAMALNHAAREIRARST